MHYFIAIDKNVSSDRNDETFNKEEELKKRVCFILDGSNFRFENVAAKASRRGSKRFSNGKFVRGYTVKNYDAKLKVHAREILYLFCFPPPFSSPFFVVIRSIEVKFSFLLDRASVKDDIFVCEYFLLENFPQKFCAQF